MSSPRLRLITDPGEIKSILEGLGIAELLVESPSDGFRGAVQETLVRPSGRDYFGPTIKDVKESADGVMSAQTDLFKTWTTYLAHTSDLMMPVSQLAGMKLGPNESIERIRAFRINQMVSDNMRLFASRNHSLQDLLRRRQEKPTFN